MSKREEFTVDEIMQDSMIRLVMKADRVDPIAFEAKLRALASRNGQANEERDDADDELDKDLLKACAGRNTVCRGRDSSMTIHR